MCECRDCDNFKAKKIEPQVGDKIKCGRTETVEGIIVALPPFYHPTSGAKHKTDILVFVKGYDMLQIVDEFTLIE